MRVDYRAFLGKLWEAMPADEYVAMASDPHVLGDPLLMTQHFVGVSKWERVSETEVVGYHQLRVPHQRYKDASRQQVAIKGHAHGSNKHWYQKIDGKWKFAGIQVEMRWGEFDFEKLFSSGRDKYTEVKVDLPVENAEGKLPAVVGIETVGETTRVKVEGQTEEPNRTGLVRG